MTPACSLGLPLTITWNGITGHTFSREWRSQSEESSSQIASAVTLQQHVMTMNTLDGSLDTSSWAHLLEGVDEPVHEDLHAKEHQQRPEEEVGQVVDDGDGQQEQPKFNTCSTALPSLIPCQLEALFSPACD